MMKSIAQSAESCINLDSVVDQGIPLAYKQNIIV